MNNFICSTTGLISVDVQLVGGKVPERDITLIKECLEAVILLVNYFGPKERNENLE